MSIGQVRYGALDLTDLPYILDPTSNFGVPAAETVTVSRLLADGDPVSGDRSGNRTIELPVTIAANSRAEFAAAEVALFREANKATNTLTVLFGAGDGLPVVADTYRGQVTPGYDADVDYDYTRSYVLTLPAEPFFRSPDPIVVAPTSTSTVIDGFDDTTGLTTSSSATVDTDTFVTSTGSVKQALTLTPADSNTTRISASWARSVSVDLSDCASVVMWLLMDLPTLWAVEEARLPTLTLSSASGSSTYHSRPGVGLLGGWVPVTWVFDRDLTSETGGGVDLSAVTGYTVEFRAAVYSTLSGTYHVWADDLRGYPHGAAEVTDGSANLFFSDIEGAGRTPISLEVDTDGSGGLLLANTPCPPPGYDPILLPLTTSPTLPYVVTRKAVSLRREAPECSTYVVVIYGDKAASVSVTATSPNGGTSSCSRTLLDTDPEYLGANIADKALFAVGELTLPPGDVDPQNTDAAVTITIETGSVIHGAWLLWAGGENVAAFFAGTEQDAWFLDAPTAGRQNARLLAGSARSSAFDVSASRSGQATINFTPGPNHLLAVALPPVSTPTTAPTLDVTLSYFSRWLSERTS